jgi:hypothetical protein
LAKENIKITQKDQVIMADKKKSKPASKKASPKSTKSTKTKKKAPPDKNKPVEDLSGAGFTLSLKGDRSLQAYKNWLNGILLSFFPDEEDTQTEEEWVKSWKRFWAKADSAAEERKKKGTSEDEAARIEKWKNMSLEERYPGITEQIRQFENAELPPCPHCGSEDTASVQVGIIGRTINIASYTRKFYLVPNMSDRKGKYHCRQCRKFFD